MLVPKFVCVSLIYKGLNLVESRKKKHKNRKKKKQKVNDGRRGEDREQLKKERKRREEKRSGTQVIDLRVQRGNVYQRQRGLSFRCSVISFNSISRNATKHRNKNKNKKKKMDASSSGEGSERGEEKGIFQYFGWVYHIGVNSVGREYCHLRFLLVRGKCVAMYKRDPHQNPGIVSLFSFPLSFHFIPHHIQL